MTTLGVTFPGADESVKYAVKQMNSTYELARKGACSPGGGMKEMHQVMLFRIGEIRKHSEFDQLNNKVQSCDELKIVENAFSGYKGPTIPYFDEWKTTHYQIMLAVLFAGFALAFIALKSNSRNLK